MSPPPLNGVGRHFIMHIMQLSRSTQNILALFFGCCLVIAVDLTLALFGVVPLSSQDELVGFAGSSPLFVATANDAVDRQVYERNPAKDRYFNRQSFVMPKPTSSFRVVSFGGSTTYGRPYLDNTSFSSWFRQLLNRYGSRPNVETINTGGISYASYRVLRVMDEMVNYQPDLFIVYSGHNEFLEARTFAAQKDEAEPIGVVRSLFHHSRLYTLLKTSIDAVNTDDVKQPEGLPPDEVVAQLEQVGGVELYHRDADFRVSVIRQYRESIEAMVSLARKQNIPIILCTLPSNLSGVSPFKSEHRADLTSAAWESWQLAFNKGLQAMDEQNWTLAVEAFSTAEQIDAGYADLHYYKAQAYEQRGNNHESLQAYVRAKEEDIVPLRALEAFNQVLREVAQQEGVPLADVDGFMRSVSPGGIPGNNLFVDHVHPTIEGQQLVAWVILDTAVKAGLVPLAVSDWQKVQAAARDFLREQDQAISPRYRAMGLWGVGRLYYWAGKSREAHVALLQAWQTIKDIPEIPRKLGLLEVGHDNGAAALKYFAASQQMQPDHPWALLGMARAYNLLKKPEQALATLGRLPANREQDPGYHAARGQALLQLGRNTDGIEALQEALKLAPEVPKSEFTLAMALNNTGQRAAAEKHLLSFLRLRHLPATPEIVKRWLEQPDTGAIKEQP